MGLNFEAIWQQAKDARAATERARRHARAEANRRGDNVRSRGACSLTPTVCST